ncbi:zf-HC2 domain-containing protein [Streptomyces clavuligerus]|uniref:Putative transmembrane anti-sigma factor n=1 Tax=Streptomyces clavuligerus TaxID=1901 RepID=E2Q5U1_STRCL|nr:zf-HC2 domain-containing protein [Streptomyces clavuligerus]ANW21711.1 anti-sigma factor [Streptomyces clavuligerus]AXU16340.1 anti-sigma factor [Streptomyces clavuligerus]EFG05101.1 putative transmembrane anti-sigma factor [Streptomyces clavuligerus]MBY6306501.1 zf-HC2 domain-containing protein [Streptomyces clavuligerus]QCS09120.1 anti-sigma factor [Streptomyces clavuligerus]
MSVRRHDSALLGAYVLGALDERERREVETHVAVCGECRVELEALGELEAALGEVPPEAFVEGPPDGGDLLLQRTLREVRAERSRAGVRRRVLLSAAAAGTAVAVLGAGFLLGRAGAASGAGDPARPSRPPAVAAPTPGEGVRFGTAADDRTGARISVRVTPASGWARVSAAVGGIPAGELCRLVVVGLDGTREIAGSWRVGGAEKGARVDGSAAVAAGDIREVLVESAAGKRYVTTRLS